MTAPTTGQGGRDALNSLYGHHPNIEAIMCFNDVIAYGVIEAIRQQGLVPSIDIKVVGFDDLANSCLMSPLLSSVTINSDDISKCTCQVLQALLNHSTPAVRTLIDVHLQIRDSSQ